MGEPYDRVITSGALKFSAAQWWRWLLGLLIPWALPACGGRPEIHIWHGDHQRVGHLGEPQDDFNLMGHLTYWESVEDLRWRLNRREGGAVTFRAYRRLVNDGDFNAEIPLRSLSPGENEITLIATLEDGSTIEKSIVLRREFGESPFPLTIDWSEVIDPQGVGQFVDGKWVLTELGLRTAQVGYDRIFLLGERAWQDYEAVVKVTIHKMAEETTPVSGGAGLGLIWRFAGHVVGGHRNFPDAQPKWGYQPFGAIGWLRWLPGDAFNQPPSLQYYPGDSDQTSNHGVFPVEPGETLFMRAACRTLPDTREGAGVTVYRFKVWREDEAEPENWNWEVKQVSKDALRSGGLALLAHHVDVTFGDLEINPLP